MKEKNSDTISIPQIKSEVISNDRKLKKDENEFKKPEHNMLNKKRKPKSVKIRINLYEQHEYEGEEIRKKVRALLKSFYGYADDNNPFGDTELSKPFVWHKKYQKMRNNGLEPIIEAQSLLVKLKDAKLEIEKIRKSRQTREEKKDAIDDEKYKLMKMTEEKKYEEWKEKDEKFHLAQEKLRTEIRIKQGREKPIDFIHKVLMIWKGVFPIPSDFLEIPEYHHPYLMFELLDKESLKELYNELKIHLQVDVERLANRKFVCFFIDIASNFKQNHEMNESDLINFIEFWNAMIVIIESYIFDEKNLKNLEPEVLENLALIINNKDFEELAFLEQEIRKTIEEQVLHTDIQFWTNALGYLQVHKFKMHLGIMYQEFKTKNKEKLHNLEKLKKDSLLGKIGIIPINNLNNDKQEIYAFSLWSEEGNLSPPIYESDEELRKNSMSVQDYLFKISDTRKALLAHQLSKWQKNIEESNSLQNPQTEFVSTTKLNDKNYDLDQKEHDAYISAKANANMIEKAKFLNRNLEGFNLDGYDGENEEKSDQEAENFLSKLKCKNKKANNTLSQLSLSTISNVGNLKNSMDMLLGTGSYASNTIKASRFYLKEDISPDFNITHEMTYMEPGELGDEETVFNDVVPLSNSNYMWASIYKPRKPRFFNRVRTGYEWNKYNQSHYDYENPPPKVIQGYKFNIFFPDLIDKTKAPQYALERSDTPDTCILRFFAGPPYEDIAFKIVNREWDMSDKAGFKNLFDRGILYLYFNFKRYRYKR